MLIGLNNDLRTDRLFGLENQTNILNTLQSKFNLSIVEVHDKYCKWDYEDNEGNHYELKSRRCMKNTYPTTLLPSQKIITTSARQIFIFKFVDKLCYIEYDDRWKKFETGWVNDTRLREKHLHYYIPITELTDI